METSVPFLDEEVNSSDQELHCVIGEIYQVYKDKLRIDVEKSFAIGDRFYAARLWEPRARDMIILMHKKHVYQQWVACARYARKWNPEQRKAHTGKPWTWFRNNNPGGPDATKDKPAPKIIKALATETLEGAKYALVQIGSRQYLIGPIE